MRVLVASTFVPFVRGGDSRIVDDLTRALRKRGHEVDKILLPFSPEPETMADQLVGFRLLDVSDAGDVLIAIRTPSYLLHHPRKVVWFIHHHRPAYDLWGTEHQDVPDTPAGLSLRNPILHADDVALREARRVYANSLVTARRLQQFNGLDTEVLYPPLMGGGVRAGSYGDYVFAPSRITPIKRQGLLIEAMAHVRSPIRLVIAGAADAEEHLEEARRRINELALDARIDLFGRWISEKEKNELYGGALAVAYAPYDEDSYGYVTLEAYEAERPVITCEDSGGTLELVRDDVTGIVSEPDPKELAAAFDRLYADRQLAAKLGRAGRQRVISLAISWDTVVDKLLA